MKTSSWIKRWTRKNSNGSVELAKPRSLRVESLENRELLSVSTAELSAIDACDDGQSMPLDVCVAPSFYESAAIDSFDNSGRPACLENAEAELIMADLRAFDATVDELLTTAGQDIDNLEKTFIFSLNSRPDSAYTIYLDFNGNEYEGLEWNGDKKVTTPPYDSQYYPYDGDDVVPYENYEDDPTFIESISEFTNSELRDIYEIWYRVSEDFSPFDVNVTTQEPANDQFSDNTRGIRVCIGGTCYDWYLQPGEDKAGGVANSRFSNNTSAPCYVFSWNNCAIDDSNNGQKYIFPKFVADTVSHEIGHTLGLSHDGTIAHDGVAAKAYYEGANNWAPLMGASFYEDLTQWSKGEYEYANNTQDDLAVITTTNGFGYRADDHGDSIATATPLNFAVAGTLGSGIIERNTDVDFFSFNLNGEKTVIKIGGVRSATNLDALVNLYDASGELIETYDPVNTFYVAIDTKVLPNGKYYLGVSGTGRTVDGDVHYTDYGSLGAYTITTDNSFDAYEPNYPASLAYDLGLVSGTKTFENAYVGGETDEFDFYLFTIGSTAASNNYVRVDYTYVPNSQWTHLRLYQDVNPQAEQYEWITIKESHVNHGDEETVAFEEIPLENLPAGTYRIRIANYGEGAHLNDYFPYTLTINAPALTPLNSVVLSNDAPELGETITATAYHANEVADPANVRYQWYRGTRSDFVTTPIIGANDSFYTTTAADLGCFLTVKAFGVNGYEGTVSATTTDPVGLVDPLWNIAVTLPNEDSCHTNDFNADGTANSISLREAYDYVNCYFVGSANDNFNDSSKWRSVANESALSYNDSTGQYYYVDDGKCYVVFKTIKFAENVRDVSLTSEITTNKSFTIKGDVVNGNGTSISLALVLNNNGDPVSPAEYVHSRIFNVQQGSITAENLALKNGSEADGGAVYVDSNAVYVANGGKFTNNTATNGGAVYVNSNGKFIAYDVNFEQNVALRRGGAILNKGTVYVVDSGTGASKFDQNKAETTSNAGGSFGGAIYNVGTVTINATDSAKPVVFTKNKATGTGSLAISSGVLNGYSGGAIYNAKGSITVYNVEFKDNFAGKYGGAISNFATLNVANSSFFSNVASAGGAVQTSGDATFTNTTFGGVDEEGNSLGNTAFGSKYSFDGELDYGGNGGAIFASNTTDKDGNAVNCEATINGATTFKNNKAANAGGAINFISGSLAFSGSGAVTVTENTAGTLGGGLVLANDLTVGEYVTFSVSSNDFAGVTVTSNDAFFKTVNTGDFAKATDVAAVAAVAEVNVENLKTIFNTDDLATKESQGYFYTFVRYSQLTSNILSYNDLAHYYTSSPDKIGVKVGDNQETLYLWKGSNVAIDLTNGSNQKSFTVKYWDASSLATDTNKYTLYVVIGDTDNVQISQIQLPATTTNGTLNIPVGVRVRSNDAVSRWEFEWSNGPDGATVPGPQTFNDKFGFTCNAYSAFNKEGQYTLTVKTWKNQPENANNPGQPDKTYTVNLNVTAQTTEQTGVGEAVLDAEADFFADLDLVDRLFED